jgi:hypothetical protein
MPGRHAPLAVIAAVVAFARPAAAVTPERPAQDYGAPRRATTVGDVALWVPRVVLFPLWLTTEYLIREPVGALVRVAEQDQWPEQVVDFFTFGNRRQITVFPSALFDFGLLPSVGFNAQWKYFVSDPNTVRLHFGTWGPDWLTVRAVDEYALGRDTSVAMETSFVERKDNPFFGVGPRSPDTKVRFQSTAADVGVRYTWRFWRSSAFSGGAGVRSLSFGSGTCCGDESLDDAVERGAVPEPPGLDDGYVAAYDRLSVSVDSRKPRPADGSGVRAEAHGEATFAPASQQASVRRSWVKYGASAGAALDLTGTQRVVSLELDAELADPLLGDVPFTDLVSLGGDRLMRGFLPNRLIDRSAVVATLKYTWPIWMYLDGVVHADIGDVFDAHFEGFAPGLLRTTAGIGFQSSGARDSGFELLVAAGTDPLEDGFRVTSFRFVIGSHHGF